MRALLQFLESPKNWEFDGADSIRESLRLLRAKGVIAIPGIPVREALAEVLELPNPSARELLSAFFQEASYTSRSIRPEKADLIVKSSQIGSELSAEFLGQKLELVREFVDRGPRQREYSETLFRLAEPTERIEIVDPYLAATIVKSPGELWLLDQLVKDFTANIDLISRPVKGVERAREGQNTEEVAGALHKRYGNRLRTDQQITLRILRPNRKADFHDREISFFFESGSVSFSLGMGIKRFGYDPISGPDCHQMPQAMARSKSLARKQMEHIATHVIGSNRFP